MAHPRDAVSERLVARLPHGRVRLPPILQGRPNPLLRRNMEAYAHEHDVRGLMGELTQSILLRMPEDPRRFLAAELLGLQQQQPADDRDKVGAMPLDSFVLSLQASAGHGREGAGRRALRITRVLSRAPSGRMARYQAERELTEQLRAVIWGGSAGGGEHHAEPHAETSASLPVPDQAPPPAADQCGGRGLKGAGVSSGGDGGLGARGGGEGGGDGGAEGWYWMAHALVLALSGMDDAGLRREFGAHADLAADDKGERRMSKAGLASFMRARGVAHGDAEVEQFLARVDADNDGEIDFGEFRALARANSDLEKVLQSKRLECILCAFFPSGTTLEDLATMDRSQFAAIVDLSKPALVQLLVDLSAQIAVVGKAQDAAGGGKFTGELKGGPLDAFYEGVTGLCGPPDADIEKGMREEHTMLPGSDVEFSTPNYGLTTTPAKEWALVVEGGSGCEKAEGKADCVIVTSTRGCCKKGHTQADVRVLRPIAHYGDFCVDGRLKWGVGDEVVVGEAFNVAGEDRWGNEENEQVLEKDTEGTVLEFNAKGAKIAFREPVSAEALVPLDQFYRLYPRPSARDTPIQRMVKAGRLRRCDVLALVLYTGVCVCVCACVCCVRVRPPAAPCLLDTLSLCPVESRSCPAHVNHYRPYCS